jgi:hypothetical protein
MVRAVAATVGQVLLIARFKSVAATKKSRPRAA